MAVPPQQRQTGRSDTREIITVTFFSDSIVTTVTSSASDVVHWISDIRRVHRRRLSRLIVGLDVEWRPNFLRGVVNPVALLQLCVGRRCLIFQLLYADGIPAALADFLADSRFRFVGVGIRNDAEKLFNDHNLTVSRPVDLREIAAEKLRRNDLRRAGIKSMAKEFLNLEVDKPKQVALSRWDSACLRSDQVQYACIDAFLSFEIGRILITQFH